MSCSLSFCLFLCFSIDSYLSSSVGYCCRHTGHEFVWKQMPSKYQTKHNLVSQTYLKHLLVMLFIQYFYYNVVTFCSHFLMQSEWNRCLHGSVFTTSSCSKCFRQMAQFLSSEKYNFNFIYIYPIVNLRAALLFAELQDVRLTFIVD